jgi:hypothetical protein
MEALSGIALRGLHARRVCLLVCASSTAIILWFIAAEALSCQPVSAVAYHQPVSYVSADEKVSGIIAAAAGSC